LWQITKDALARIVPPEQFAQTADKIVAFAAAAGTILYFEEMKIVEGLQNSYPAYSENFPIWSNQSNGMLQSNIWVALSAEGLGASLQHYNPIIDEEIKKRWHISTSWKLIAQMPFGNPVAPAGEKAVTPVAERILVFK
jgi:predicted oxidoreductase (fatty acid repression mutant protein)